MMTEISLNILDVVQNSVRAEAKCVEININVQKKADTLKVIIRDNGKGMSQVQLENVTDPFYTTRTTRKVGLGIPFFKLAAESTGGRFEILSEKGVGTKVTALFVLSHIDRMPLGNMVSTIHTLVTMNTDMDFIYTYTVDDESFTLDTRTFREILGDVPFNTPEVSKYIKEYLSENEKEVNKGLAL